MVGGGPGDPGLLTLHALNALRQADVIIYDALVNQAILDWANPAAIIEYAGKRGGKPSPCLLYTSPSPRDAHESRMPSSA